MGQSGRAVPQSEKRESDSSTSEGTTSTTEGASLGGVTTPIVVGAAIGGVAGVLGAVGVGAARYRSRAESNVHLIDWEGNDLTHEVGYETTTGPTLSNFD